MKKILFLSLLSTFAFAQGVQWQNSLDDAFKTAKALDKPVFVEVYLTGCHVCESFVPVFNGQQVGSFMNPKFVSVKIEANSADAKKLQELTPLYFTSFPLILFFDKNGKFQHHAFLGENQGADMVIQHASTSLDTTARSSNWKRRYRGGERNTGLLIDYAMLCRLQKDTSENIAVVKELYEAYPKNELNSQMSWLITQKLVMDTENGFFQYWINNMPTAQRFAQGHEKDVLGTITLPMTLYSSRGNKYNVEQVNRTKGYLAKLGLPMAAVIRNTLMPEVRALLKAGLTDRAVGLLEEYFKTAKPTASEYAFLIRYFNTLAPDTKYASAAQVWFKKAVLLVKDNKEAADLHYESAALWLRLNDKKEALKAANMALKAAQLSKTETGKFEEMVGKCR